MKRCPYCNAQMADESNFCGECGKEYPQGNTCPYCGAKVYEGDVYCEKCGRNLADGSYADTSITGEKIAENSVNPIKKFIPYLVGAIAIIAIGVGGWFGYDKYSAYTAEKQAREKIISDSLEAVRQDSLRMVEQKEKDELEAKKLAEFREKFTFENLLSLIKNHDNVEAAKKCGLSLIYKDVENDGEVECVDIVYGYEVERGSDKQVVAKSDNACYLYFSLDTSTQAILYFNDAADADYFQNMAKEYGLIIYEYNKYVPKKRMSSGYHNVDSLDWDGEYAPMYSLSNVSSERGWYVVNIGIDF